MNSDFSSAEKHLQVIRSLMERATIYRAISAQTALVGGTLSLLAYASVLSLQYEGIEVTQEKFLLIWSIVFVLTSLSNTLSLWWGSKKRQEPFFSSGLKLACLSLLPYGLLFFVATWNLRFKAEILPPFWMLFYGLALISTQHFAPRSLVLLGWSFFLTGLGILFSEPLTILDWLSYSSALMAVTFGLYHLIYAGVVYYRKEDQTSSLDLRLEETEISQESHHV